MERIFNNNIFSHFSPRLKRKTVRNQQHHVTPIAKSPSWWHFRQPSMCFLPLTLCQPESLKLKEDSLTLDGLDVGT